MDRNGMEIWLFVVKDIKITLVFSVFNLIF